MSVREQRLQSILHEYQQALGRGEQPDSQALLAAHPDLREELASYFANALTMHATIATAPTRMMPDVDGAPSRADFDIDVNGPAAEVRAFGDYELLEEIARGGMGVVYKARQVSLNRIVALKMILKGEFASQADVFRFRQEAEAAAHLDHQHIVPIYEVGEQAGQQYFSMKLIDAQSIRRVKRSPAEAARLLSKVARAVQHAHERGILHRDLKPGNILIDRQGEPHVADFGLAKQLSNAGSLSGNHPTQSGAIVGTPAYMAPEQARAEKSLTTAVDVYSLGAILYEWLTGRAPFGANDPLSTLMQVIHEEPKKPRSWDGSIDPDLETICLKCLAKEPAKRYPSAAALADDLDRFQRGEPIQARRASARERFWRWCRRNPALATASGLALTALLAVAVVSSVFAISQTKAAAKLRETQAETDAALRESQLRATSLELDRCITLCERGDVALGVLCMVQCLETAPKDAAEMRQAIRKNLAGWSERLQELLHSPIQHPHAVRAVGFSDDGQRMLTSSYDGTALVSDVATGKPIGPPLRHGVQAWAAAISPDGETVVTGGRDGLVRIWDVKTGELRGKPLENGKDVPVVVISPDGRTLLAGGRGRGAQLWDLATGEPLGPPVEPANGTDHAAFSPDGKTIATSDYGDIRITDSETRRELGSIKVSGRVNALAFSPSGEAILIGGDKNVAQLWDVETLQPLGPPMKHQYEVVSAAFHPDGESVLIGCEDATVRLWNPVRGTPIGPPIVHPGAVWACAFHPDGRTILTGCGDFKARLWRLPPRDTFGPVLHNAINLRNAAFSPDGKIAAAGSWIGDGAVGLWHVATGEPVCKPLHHKDHIGSFAFSPDGKYLLTTGLLHSAHIWDAATGERSGPPLEHQARVHWVSFSPDGKFALTAGDDGTVRLWDAATRQPAGSPMRLADGPSLICFSPDGQTILTGSNARIAQLWKTATCQPIGSPMRYQSIIRCGCFSSDGRMVLVGGDDQTARCWDARTGEPVSPMLQHQGPVMFGAFCPGDKTVLTMGFDRTARFWDIKTGKVVGSPMLHPGVLRCGALSADGTFLLTPGLDGTARMWGSATCKPLGPPLENHSPIWSAAISPDRETILTACLDGTARLWKVPKPVEDDAALLRLRIAAQTGMELDGNGVPVLLEDDAWQERRRQFAELDRVP